MVVVVVIVAVLVVTVLVVVGRFPRPALSVLPSSRRWAERYTAGVVSVAGVRRSRGLGRVLRVLPREV
jgi:threonine/homoserine/homoserine lactone efflux protein